MTMNIGNFSHYDGRMGNEIAESHAEEIAFGLQYVQASMPERTKKSWQDEHSEHLYKHIITEILTCEVIQTYL